VAPSSHCQFMQDEVARLMQANPQMRRADAVVAASKSWATSDANPENKRRRGVPHVFPEPRDAAVRLVL
jgi:hypothetical protein